MLQLYERNRLGVDGGSKQVATTAPLYPTGAHDSINLPDGVCFSLPRDGILVLAMKVLRMFNYGGIAPVFFLSCLSFGLTEFQTGRLLTCILIGDFFITLWLTTRADTLGRKRVLVVASLLQVLVGITFASANNFYSLAVVGVLGIISTAGTDIGPFVAIEQAILTDAIIATRGSPTGLHISGDIAKIFGWYNALGYAAQASGALASGVTVSYLQSQGLPQTLCSLLPGNQCGKYEPADAYRAIFRGYACVGGLMAVCYLRLSSVAEAQPSTITANQEAEQRTSCGRCLRLMLPKLSLGLHRPESRYIISILSAMFAMDALGGCFILQTWISFWFASRWDFSMQNIGYFLMSANLVAGASSIAATYFVQRFGPMLTMIASHLPSNILLLGVPFMPSGPSAAGLYLARCCISQMDIPARQAYVIMVVASDERSAAGGITSIVRSLGSSMAPLLLGYLSAAKVGSAMFDAPWLIAGFIKMSYDIILYSLYRCGSGLKSKEASAVEKDIRERSRT